MVGLGIPEYEAKRYEGKVKEGGILISVHSDSNDETKRAKDIFKESGAHDISTTGEAHADLKAGEVSDTADTRGRDVIRRVASPKATRLHREILFQERQTEICR